MTSRSDATAPGSAPAGPGASAMAGLSMEQRLAAAERRAEEAERQVRVEQAAVRSERAARESWEREFNAANAERIRLHNEVERLAERIGQFEAAGFPNVATVLDRIEAERAARERAERERDEAKEALADAGTLMGRTISMSYCTAAEMPERDHTHALPSAMLRVIRERDKAESSLSRAVEALREIDRRTGHFGEAPPPPEWMPMLSLIAWVGRTARAVLAEVGK